MVARPCKDAYKVFYGYLRTIKGGAASITVAPFDRVSWVRLRLCIAPRPRPTLCSPKKYFATHARAHTQRNATMQRNARQHSTTQHNKPVLSRYSSLHARTGTPTFKHRNTMQLNTTQCNSTQHIATQCNTMHLNAMRCNSTQHNANQRSVARRGAACTHLCCAKIIRCATVREGEHAGCLWCCASPRGL